VQYHRLELVPGTCCAWPRSPEVDLMTPDEVGALLSVKRTTLENWRIAGKGPKYVKLGGRASSARSALSKPSPIRTMNLFPAGQTYFLAGGFKMGSSD
jgi:hypothetical protein